MWQDAASETTFETESIHSEGYDKYKNEDQYAFHNTNLNRRQRLFELLRKARR